MSVNIGNSWDELLKEEFEKSYYKQLRKVFDTGIQDERDLSIHIRYI